MVRVFVNGPGERSSIPSRVIPKTKNIVLNASFLNTHHYKIRIKSKWSNPGKEISPFPTNGSSNLAQTTRHSYSQQQQQQKKRTHPIVDFAVPADHRVKLKESKKRDKYKDLARERKEKKTMEHERDVDIGRKWSARYSHQSIATETGRLGNKRMSRDHSRYSIIEVGQNTEKSPGDLRTLAVTRTPLRNYQLTLVSKTLKRVRL